MPDLLTWLAFVGACAVLVAVPGPTVTVIIANSLREGTRAGLLTVAGTQFGIFTMMLIVAAGLEVIVAHMGALFDVIRILGAIYLIWLGIRLLRSDGTLGADTNATGSRSCFWHGFIVIWSNPKALLLFGAFIPQFIDPAGNTIAQTLFLGFSFMAVATTLDSAYAFAAGKASHWLSRSNVRRVEVFSGCTLVFSGLWLAFQKN